MKMLVDGLTVAYEDQGQGPVALLLHGWGTDHRSLSLVSKALSGFRVIAIDLAGFGGSEMPRESWTIQDYSDFVEHCLDKLGITDQLALLVGHSFGGRIALDYLARNSDRAARLVLIASHGLPEPKTLRSTLARLGAKVGKVLTAPLPSDVKQSLRRQLYSFAGNEDYLNSGVMKDTFLEVIKQDVSNIAPKIKTPTLLIYGAQDQTTPPELGRRIASLLPNSNLVVINEAGHYVHLDQTDQVINKIKTWLA